MYNEKTSGLSSLIAFCKARERQREGERKNKRERERERERNVHRKRSRKINYDVILHYISLPIYPLHFPKFCPIQKQ